MTLARLVACLCVIIGPMYALDMYTTTLSYTTQWLQYSLTNICIYLKIFHTASVHKHESKFIKTQSHYHSGILLHVWPWPLSLSAGCFSLAYWSHPCSLNMLGLLPPRGLCTYFLFLEDSLPGSYTGPSWECYLNLIPSSLPTFPPFYFIS